MTNKKNNKHLLSTYSGFAQILSFFPQNNTKLVSFPFYRPKNRETQGNPEDRRAALCFFSTFTSAQSLLDHYSLRPHFSSSIKWEYHLSHLFCRILVRSMRQWMGKNFSNHEVLSSFGGTVVTLLLPSQEGSWGGKTASSSSVKCHMTRATEMSHGEQLALGHGRRENVSWESFKQEERKLKIKKKKLRKEKLQTTVIFWNRAKPGSLWDACVALENYDVENESQVEEKRISSQKMSSERKEAKSQIQEKLA